MNKNIIFAIVGGILLSLICLNAGYYWGNSTAISPKNTFVADNNISQVIKNMAPGTSIEINTEEGISPGQQTFEGQEVHLKSNRDYTRFFSWFGLGGPEAAVKDQGFNISNAGEDITAGQQKGYGILEQLWNRIKSLFWFLTFGAVILIVLLFVPATAPLAGAILRGIASIFPVIGSLVERIVAGFQWKKPLVQTVSGGQTFKETINGLDWLTVDQKQKIIDIFKTSMQTQQDASSQQVVKNIKTNL